MENCCLLTDVSFCRTLNANTKSYYETQSKMSNRIESTSKTMAKYWQNSQMQNDNSKIQHKKKPTLTMKHNEAYSFWVAKNNVLCEKDDRLTDRMSTKMLK